MRFASVGDAARAVIKIVQAGPKALCRCEMLNADGIEATNKMYDTDLGESYGVYISLAGRRPRRAYVFETVLSAQPRSRPSSWSSVARLPVPASSILTSASR